MIIPSGTRFSTLSLLTLALASTLPSRATVVTLNASDAASTTSFNAAGHWDNSTAPGAGNTYFTSNFLLRTPASSGYTGTFGGDSLTVNNTNGTTGGLIVKSNGTSNITINNLIIDGGSIRDGNGSSDTINLLGAITITSNGGLLTMQEAWNIQSGISGAGNLTVADPGLQLTFSGANTSTGSLIFNTANSKFTLASGGSMSFSIGANLVNNAVKTSGSGAGTATFNGTFNFDLTGADTTLGNSWTIVGSGLTKSFSGTFAVNGFTETNNVWTSTDGVFQFSEATGVLSVVSAIPEPAGYGIAASLALFTVAAVARRRREATA
ncbi:MAG: hypothetical protein JF599_08410 [Verrucomicrobia bacterium]|nr:hypothetical protein [Verrucomicrobiota bacterium]